MFERDVTVSLRDDTLIDTDIFRSVCDNGISLRDDIPGQYGVAKDSSSGPKGGRT